MSVELARKAVDTIHQKIAQLPLLDVAQIPAHLSPSEHGRIEQILRETVRDYHPEIQRRIENEYFGCGPLEILLNDESVTEIIINGPASVTYEKDGRLHLWPDSFLSAVTYKNFIVRLCRDANAHVSIEHPFASGKWQQFRLHFAAPPCCEADVVVCMRRHPKIHWNFASLLNSGWCTERQINILSGLLKERKNVLVVGATGSGKTSVLNACMAQFSETERVVLIEDTPELHVPNAVSTKLLTRTDYQNVLPEIDQSELVRQALRMRPDRLVVGEVRGSEAKDLLLALATGHQGSLGSLHADSARQALLRLEMLIQLGAPQWSLMAIRNLILVSLQVIVVVKKDESGKRRLEGIYRIASLEEFGFLLEPLA